MGLILRKMFLNLHCYSWQDNLIPVSITLFAALNRGSIPWQKAAPSPKLMSLLSDSILEKSLPSAPISSRASPPVLLQQAVKILSLYWSLVAEAHRRRQCILSYLFINLLLALLLVWEVMVGTRHASCIILDVASNLVS